MKRVLRTTMMALLVMMLLVSMMAPAAMAAYVPVTAEVPVTIYMQAEDPKGDLPDSDVIPVTVVPLTEGSPVKSVPSLITSVPGAAGASANIVFGDFNKPGIHEYGVTIGASSHEYVLDDAPVYYVVRVTVTNNEDYTGLETTVAIRPSDDKFTLDENVEKCSIEDTNIYLSPLKITVVKKWASSDGFPVRMDLIRITKSEKEDGSTKEVEEVVKTVTVSASNKWQYTFTDLDPRYDWTVEEDGVTGFYSTKKVNKENPFHWIITITNYKGLYQTGQLNWPIPVLMCFGSMFVLAGAYLMRKKEEPTNE